jgi:hypothetical protein
MAQQGRLRGDAQGSGAQKHMKEAIGIAKSAQPVLYSLCQSYEA